MTSGSLSDEIDVLSSDDRLECEQALASESIEYHREKHLKCAVLARIVSQVRMVWLVHSCGTLYFVCARVLIRAYAHGSLCVLSVHTRVRQVLEEQGQRRTPVDYRKMMDETPSGSVDVYVRCAKLLLLKRLDSLAACEPLLYLCAQ